MKVTSASYGLSFCPKMHFGYNFQKIQMTGITLLNIASTVQRKGDEQVTPSLKSLLTVKYNLKMKYFYDANCRSQNSEWIRSFPLSY